MAAKPIIDLDVVMQSRHELPIMVTRLGRLDYEHRGNLGVQDREAFRARQNQPAHHLYVCPHDSTALRNHIALRDHLRAHPTDAATYSDLKKQLAAKFARDVDQYIAGKTNFILSILAQYEFPADLMDSIRQANQS